MDKLYKVYIKNRQIDSKAEIGLTKKVKHTEYDIVFDGFVKHEVTDDVKFLDIGIYAYACEDEDILHEIVTKKPLKLLSDEKDTYNTNKFLYYTEIEEVEPTTDLLASFSFLKHHPEYLDSYLFWMKAYENQLLASSNKKIRKK